MVAIFTGQGAGLDRGSGSLLGSGGLLGTASFGRSGEQIFVNAATGNLVITRQDEFLVGKGPDAAQWRTYNSTLDAGVTDDDGFVDNWQLGLSRFLENADGSVSRITPDGAKITYIQRTDLGYAVDTYVTTDGSGAHDTLVKSGSGQNTVWTWTEGSTQRREQFKKFDGLWRLSKVLDTDSNTLSYAWASGKLVSVTTANGESIGLVTSGTGERWDVSYTDLIASSAQSLTRTYYDHVTYLYNGQNCQRVVVTTDLSPYSIGVTDGNHYQTVYDYDQNGRIVAVSETDGSNIVFAYDAAGRVREITTAVANGVTRKTVITYGVGYSDIKDALGATTRLTYDSQNRLTQITAPPAQTGATSQVTKFSYDADGNLIQLTDPLDHKTYYTPDLHGNIKKIVDPLGHSTTRTFDNWNAVLTETVSGNDLRGTDRLHTTRYVYDDQGVGHHLRFVISPLGGVTEYRYAANGLLTAIVGYPEQDEARGDVQTNSYPVSNLDPTTPIAENEVIAWRDAIPNRSSIILTLNTYDARGNLTNSTNYSASQPDGSATNAEGLSRTSFVYDQAGQLIKRTALGRASEFFTYDGMGRLIASTDVAGQLTSINFADASGQTIITLANGAVKTSTYNRAGELITVSENGRANAASYRYDKDGRLRAVVDASGVGSYALYDAAGRKTADVAGDRSVVEYRYDDANRLIATIRWDTAISVAKFNRVTDENDAVTIADIRPAAGVSPKVDLWSWNIYDDDDRLIETIAGDGSVAKFDYDASDRLIGRTSFSRLLTSAQLTMLRDWTFTVPPLPVVDAQHDVITRTFYDADGRLIGTLDGRNFVTENKYDAAGRLVQALAYTNATSVASPASATFADIVVGVPQRGNVRRTDYVYDGQGQLRFTIDSLGHVFERVFDTAGALTSTIAYADALSITDYSYASLDSAVAGIASNPLNRRDWIVYDTAGRVAYTIDSENAVTRFSYDSLGAVINETAFATTRATSALPAFGTMEAWCDPNSGPAGAAVANNPDNRVTRTFRDLLGRAAFVVDGEGYVVGYEYDDADRVIATKRYDVAKSFGAGATTQQVRTAMSGATAVQTSAEYDTLGRLLNSWDGVGARTSYSYDVNGLLDYFVAAAGTTNQVKTAYTYDAAGRVASMTAAAGATIAATSFYTYDGLGNRTSVLNPDGNTQYFYFDELGQKIFERDALGYVTEFAYNSFGEIKSTIRAAKTATNDPTAVPQYQSDPAKDALTAYSYDRLGRVQTVTDAENYTTTTTYTAFGDVETVTRDGTTTSFTYDRESRIKTSSDGENVKYHFTINAFGNSSESYLVSDNKTLYKYDRRGLKREETLPILSFKMDGSSNSVPVKNKFDYDSRGNLVQLVEAAGLPEQRTTDYEYDGCDRLRRTILPEVIVGLSDTYESTGISARPEAITKYDLRGNVIERIEPENGRTLYYYDRLDRMIVSIDALGGYTQYLYTRGGGEDGGTLTTIRFETPVSQPIEPGNPDDAHPTPPPPGGATRQSISEYDKLGRVISTSSTGIRTGTWTESVFSINDSNTIMVATNYDAFGNAISVTDARLNTVYAYYDRLGRKKAQIDAARFLTEWSLDGDGNALSEKRYANAVVGTLSDQNRPLIDSGSGTTPRVTSSNDDRSTTFIYDDNGRRTSETRTSVSYSTINATSGALTDVSGSATIMYEYNDLGQVKRRIEATGDAVAYEYDAAGRLIQETRAGYVDHLGVTVTPTVRYFYDGLGNLVRTEQGGATPNALTDRATRYEYGTGGRLRSVTDAAGNKTSFAYDTAGRTLREQHNRQTSTGGTVREADDYSYDVLGRLTAQTNARWDGAHWVVTDETTNIYVKTLYRFNGFGDLAAKGTIAASASATDIQNFVCQEQFFYDNAGRLAKTNSEDGVWKLFFYDANGNRSLVFTSAGADLQNVTLDAARMSLTGSGDTVTSGAVTTITGYDARNQAISTVSPDRRLAADATSQTISQSCTYNAFGEVAWETDALGYTTDYTYNALGRVMRKTLPSISITDAAGTSMTLRPYEDYRYDRSGRLIGVLDANNAYLTAAQGAKFTTRRLLAGTGYGGTEAIVLSEFRRDGGEQRQAFDVFGDQRKSQLWYQGAALTVAVARDYDALGRVVTQTDAAGLVDHYTYDLDGQRLTHWNSLQTNANVEQTDYDVNGRVIRSVAFGGDTRTTRYAWSASLSTGGLGTYGGWIETSAVSSTLGSFYDESQQQYDLFGHVVSETDLGSHTTTSSYDKGGRLVMASGNGSGAETRSYNYLNTGLVSGVTATGGIAGTASYRQTVATYGYDKVGRKTSETETATRSVTEREYDSERRVWLTTTYSVTETLKNASAQYNALGWMTHWGESGTAVDGRTAVTPAASMDWSYDRVGNVRSEAVTASTLDPFGSPQAATTNTRWYLYDTMDRVTRQGVWNGSAIVRDQAGATGFRGTDITYRADGQRAYTERTETRMQNGFLRDGSVREYYDYDIGSRLQHVWRAAFGIAVDGTVIGPGAAPDYAQRDAIQTADYYEQSFYRWDALGRLTEQVDYADRDVAAIIRRGATRWDAVQGKYVFDPIAYDTAGRVTHDEVTTLKTDGANLVTSTDYAYVSDTGEYALGALMKTAATTTNGVGGSVLSTVTTSHAQAWYDGAVVSGTSVFTDYADATPDTNYSTSYILGPGGAVRAATITDGRPRQVTFAADANGQIVRRDEQVRTGPAGQYSYADSAGGDPHARWYRFDARELGSVGNNGATDASYDASVDTRRTTPGSGAFRNGAPSGLGYARFGQGIEQVNSAGQGADGGRYTVAAGDTLAGVALRLWGDASLWYKLAQVNGLSAESELIEGQTLTIPAGVVRSANNAGSLKPYDATETLGDLSPTTPAPQAATAKAKKNKCGVFGQILVVAIAIAVAVALRVPVTGVLGGNVVAGGAAAAATGSVVSQGVGLATGIQDQFSFKGVALAAIGGGVGRALSGVNAFGSASGIAKFGSDVVRGALGSAATQGIAVASGLQSKFDFAGVAAAGVVGGVGGAVSRGLMSKNGLLGIKAGPTSFGNSVISGTASSIAGAAARSLVTGTSFGDNIMAVLPDVIGSTVGRLVGERIAGGLKLAIDPAPLGNDDSVTYRDATGARTVIGGVNAGGQWSGYDAGRQVSAVNAGDQGQEPAEDSPSTVMPDIVVTATPHMMADVRAFGDDEFRDLMERAAAGGWDDPTQNDAVHHEAHTLGLRRMVGGGTSLALDFIPFVGFGKAVVQLGTGKDAITGLPSSAIGNGIGIASSVLPGGVVLGRGLAKGGRIAAERAPIDIAANEAAWARAAAEAKGPYSLVGANRAVIDPRKLTDYAMNPVHPVGGNKARVFESAFGFNAGNADDLMLQLRQGVMETPATIGKIDQYGTRFTVDIPVTGPTGSGAVRTGWIYRPGSNTPELTTLFPK